MSQDAATKPNTGEQPKKMDLRSHDIAAERIAELLRLFPEIRTEAGKLDFERLRLALGESVDVGKERYGMNWPGKADCFKTIQTPSVATLRPCPEESVNWDTTENLIIEGDNLEVLKLLQKSYLGRIKMIYIDPPYNTGKDFIYPDNYSESLQTYLEYTGQTDAEGKKFGTNTDADGRFHSKWMNMMYPRLYLARNLLRDDGVIFISIDDQEYDNLRKLCNEVFGEENFLATCIWQHSVQPKGYSGTFSVHHNYLLVYQKSTDFMLCDLDRTDEHNKNYSNPDNDPNGDWRSGDVRNALYRPNLIYEIPTPSGKTIKPPPNGWRWSKDTLNAKIRTGEIVFSADESRIIRKIYLKTLEGRTPETILFGKDVGTTRDAATELKGLFGGDVPFDTPKPTSLIKHMCSLAGVSADDIVLDFFAGSGSTAHAVLSLNTADSVRCRFIIAQLPEPTGRNDYPTIADICKERVRRVIKGLNDEEAGTLDMGMATPDRGFRVYKLAESNFTEWDARVEPDAEALQKQMELHIEHIRDGRTADDILYELLLKSGFPLTTPVEKKTLAGKTVHAVAGGALMICLERELTLELIRAIADAKPERVVLLDAGFAKNDQLKANAVQTFRTKGVTSFKTV
ncbi:MAG: site-specific DNA-methyltransferase [Phycisphaeraceae bacterium]|nr:site-specific DNA-methyltransferase [Phycisphaeraceae bacterium]